MGSVLNRLPPESAVAILRLRSLGDCVLTTPALTILRNARPDLRLAVMVEDRFREVFEGVTQTLRPDLRALRGWRPQLCLNLHGGTRSSWLTALSGAKYKAGFQHYRNQFVYNVKIPRAQEILRIERTVHTAEHLASAMFYLGAPPVEIPAARLLPPAILQPASPPYAVIHPVAATPAKTWPAGNFLAIAAHLRQSNLQPVFIGAAHDDLTPFAAYRTVQGASLNEVKSLLSAAALFVGNDSGPAHMAAAFGLPTIVLFGESDPAIWGPWRTHSRILRSPRGIDAIAPSEVLEAVERIVPAARPRV